MAMSNSNDKISFEVKEVLGALGPRKETGYQKLITICSFNNGEDRVDIREWNESMDRMSKGLRITESECEELYKILTERYSTTA